MTEPKRYEQTDGGYIPLPRKPFKSIFTPAERERARELEPNPFTFGLKEETIRQIGECLRAAKARERAELEALIDARIREALKP